MSELSIISKMNTEKHAFDITQNVYCDMAGNERRTKSHNPGTSAFISSLLLCLEKYSIEELEACLIPCMVSGRHNICPNIIALSKIPLLSGIEDFRNLGMLATYNDRTSQVLVEVTYFENSVITIGNADYQIARPSSDVFFACKHFPVTEHTDKLLCGFYNTYKLLDAHIQEEGSE